MADVARIITVGFRARAYLTRRPDHTSPIHTGCRATTLRCYIPRAVAISVNDDRWQQRKVSFMRLSASLDSPTAQPQPIGPAIPLLRDGSVKVRREPKNVRLGGVLEAASERVSQAKLP